MRFRATVRVMLKPGIADPQGHTIERALPALGYAGVSDVRVGKMIELCLEAPDAADARDRVVEMSERFLSNPVIETFDVAIEADRDILVTPTG